MGGTMKKVLLSASALAALAAFIAAPATAADLRVRPVYRTPVVPVWTWTGFYVGANGGGSIGVSTTTDTATFAGLPAASGPPAGALFSTAYRRTPTGGLFGGQLGYNWQT